MNKENYKRIVAYLNERFPVIPRLILGYIFFLEITYIIILNYNVKNVSIGVQELVGGFTVFGFLLWLRIADDIKDYEIDKVLFPDRPLPRGSITIKELFNFCLIIQIIVFVLNYLFMNNFEFLIILYFYGFLMSKWFFQKTKISKCLPLALVTHNPVQIFVNLYGISYVCIKYNLNYKTIYCLCALMTLYFPALIWEIARKIRTPKEETEYVTYSKLFGYKKATKFIMLLTLLDIFTNIILVMNLNRISVIVLIVLVSVMMYWFISFIKDSTKFKIVDKVEQYTYLQETTMLITIALYVMIGKI